MTTIGLANFSLRSISNAGLRGDHQAGDGGGILECDAHDLGRIDDTGSVSV